MSLAELRLEDLRCLRRAQLILHPRLNLITGNNGSGKTSILEAIYLLGRGRSFRTRHTEHLVRHTASELRVFGQVESAASVSHNIGVVCNRQDGVHARIDAHEVASRAELSELFPIQVIDPGIHRLVEEGPVQRRRWLDWAVFHVEPDFVRHWQGYSRALRQRNAALKTGADPAIWNWELVRLGDILTAARVRLIAALQPYWSAALRELDMAPVSLGYFQGWSREQELAAALTTHIVRDRERGSTSYGPHRFDVLLRLEGRPARDLVSRGQQKLLGAAMALTMSRYVTEAAGRVPTLLLDDPAAELDRPHTERLLAAVAALGGQLVVTALYAGDTPLGTPDRVFHVEHNEVKTAILSA
ncbi:MAG: DNA replication/repair protein RecF [Steroidobacterales bacterium]